MSWVLALVAGWVLILLVAGAVLAALGLASRRILLGRTGGTVVVECRAGRDGDGRDAGGRKADGVVASGAAVRTVELAMSEEALTGFLAWLEAAPPGYLSGLS